MNSRCHVKTGWFVIRIIVILIIFIGGPQDCFTQDDLFFHKYSLPEGNNGGKEAVIQDDLGFYWFKNHGQGIFRFDGDHFEKIPVNVTHAVNPDWIQSLKIDDYGRIWILGLDFIAVYDENTESFREITFQANQGKILKSLTFFYPGSNGRVWAGYEDQLIWFQITESFESVKLHLVPPIYDPENKPYKLVKVLENGDGLWVLTQVGLLALNHKGEAKKLFPIRKKIYDGQLYIDFKRNVWISTISQGPVLFDPVTEQMHYPWDNLKNITGQIDSTTIHSLSKIIQENDSIYWIGTNGSGLIRYNLFSKSAQVFRGNPFRVGAIGEDKINDLFRDRYGNILIRTPAKQFYVLKRNMQHVKWYFHSSGEVKSIGSREVSAAYLDANSTIWIGVEGAGIDQINVGQSLIRHYKPSTSDSNSLENAKTMSIIRDSRGWVWVGQWEGGLTRFHPEKDRFIRYPASSVASDSTIAGITVNTLFEDKKENIWVATSEGIDIFNKSYQLKKRLPIEDIWVISEEDDRILLGGEGRFGYLQGDSLVTLAEGKSYGSILKNGGIYYLYDFVKGVVRWTENGFVSEDSTLFQQLTGGIPDDKGNLWFQKNNYGGIVRYRPDSNSLELLFQIEGSKAGPAFHRQGHIWGISSLGLFWFDPNALVAELVSNPPIITRLKINNQRITPDGSDFLDNPLHTLDQISLDHHVHSFELTFTAPYLGAENKTNLEYKLKGYDEDWIPAGISHSAMYMNLDPGNYTFIVRSSSGMGSNESFVTSLDIQITPAPWASWWAFLAYTLSILGLIILVTYNLTKQARLRQSVKHQMLELRQARKLDVLKTQFFTNISHEFRTPLTLILGPLKQLKEGNLKGEQEEILEIMLRNSERLLKLINQLLDLNKIESGAASLKISIVDFVDFSKNVYTSFESVARMRKIEFIHQSNVSKAPMYFDEDKMEKALTNLLSNAFKITPEGGAITLSLTSNTQDSVVDKGEGVLQVCITDTGQGIPPDKLTRIFDHFYQVDQDSTRVHEGSGVGLALVKQYVEMHQGTVKVVSKPDQGSSFTILLPQGRTHLTGLEIHGTNDYQPLLKQDAILSAKVLSYESEEDIPRLLIIEDNQDMRKYLKGILGDDYSIIEAVDGVMGFETALENIPDIVISDVMMPGMDGYQLCSKLKRDERTSHIPVILLTARAGEEAKLEGLKFGADDYVTKPFSPVELKVRVQNLMELIRSLREQYGRESLVNWSGNQGNSREQRFLNRFLKVLEINRSNTDYGAVQFAGEMGMSRSQLHRKLKALTGMAVGEYIKTYRLKYAKELLENNFDNIAQVAYESGFNSPSYFTESFKKEFGYLPSEVRK